MPLPSPNLDNPDFQHLMKEALDTIAHSCPDWKFSVADPGYVLLEAFAHLTETMIYRLNRIPEKAYIEFLRLIDVRLEPPAAASVSLKFSLNQPAAAALSIRRGTRVTASRGASGGEPVVFTTAKYAEISAGATDVVVLAHHCDLVEAELAGVGTGAAGLSVNAKRPPIIAPTGEELDLVVGVEAAAGELDLRAPAIEHEGKGYRIWRTVDHFTELKGDRYVYVVDRMSGQITFAPSAQMMHRPTVQEKDQLEAAPRPLAEVPPAGREIRLWYRRGGGSGGNVAAHVLESLKDPIRNVTVTNPAPATGGREAESLSNALVRGPQELHSLRRAVTANDFEVLALRASGAVSRARAFTQAMIWVHALPGTVEVRLVPAIPAEERPDEKITRDRINARQTPEALRPVQDLLNDRRPLGTTCMVEWACYKSVRVRARVVVRAQEDRDAVGRAVLQRIYSLVSPLPTALQTGWPFGQTLRVSNVYDAVLYHPGVRYVDRVQLEVEEAPDTAVSAVRVDSFQPQQLAGGPPRQQAATWFAGSGSNLFRSVNNGDGWEVAGRFAGPIRCIAVHPARPGTVAVAASAQVADGQTGSALHISFDSGETWQESRSISTSIESAAWILRGSVPVLLFVTKGGLYELSMESGATPKQVEVRSKEPERGYYALAASGDVNTGAWNVAVAAQSQAGVYLSVDNGKSGSFRPIGLKGEDVRVLEIQGQGVRSFLWAGLAAPSAGDPGSGCRSWELVVAGDPPEGWQTYSKGWSGGSCKSIAFQGASVVAGSHHAGTLFLAGRTDDAVWQPSQPKCGLPLRETEQLFQPVDAVACDIEGKLILAAGSQGIYRTAAPDAKLVKYENCSSKVALDRVALPATWLFCSGEHAIDVVSEDEA